MSFLKCLPTILNHYFENYPQTDSFILYIIFIRQKCLKKKKHFYSITINKDKFLSQGILTFSRQSLEKHQRTDTFVLLQIEMGGNSITTIFANLNQTDYANGFSKGLIAISVKARQILICCITGNDIFIKYFLFKQKVSYFKVVG